MEYNNINTSEVENAIKEVIKERIEKLINTELDVYLEDNPGVKNVSIKEV